MGAMFKTTKFETAKFETVAPRHKRMTMRAIAIAALLIVAGNGPALAQATPGSAGAVRDTAKKTTPPSVPPSQQRSAKNGVIKPEHNIDPGMVKKPPEHDRARMPVIPPKATLGGATAK